MTPEQNKHQLSVKELMETVTWLENYKSTLIREQNFSDAAIIRRAIKAIREQIKLQEP